jgi:hypothetical protein
MDDDQQKPNPPTSERRMFLAPRAAAGDGHGYRYTPLRRPDRDIIVNGQPRTEPPSPETLQTIRDATRLTDEPECVGPSILDSYQESARFYESLRHLAEVEAAQQARRMQTVAQRVRDAQDRAKRTQTDFSHEFHICRKMLERAKAGGRKDPPAALRIIEKIESRLDGTQLDGLHRAA